MSDLFGNHIVGFPKRWLKWLCICIDTCIESDRLRKHAHAIYRDFKSCKIFFFIFLIFAQNIDCGYTLEPPRRGGSNEYPQSMFWSKRKKKNKYTPAFAI